MELYSAPLVSGHSPFSPFVLKHIQIPVERQEEISSGHFRILVCTENIWLKTETAPDKLLGPGEEKSEGKR